jgi:hypothetical protein
VSEEELPALNLEGGDVPCHQQADVAYERRVQEKRKGIRKRARRTTLAVPKLCSFHLVCLVSICLAV